MQRALLFILILIGCNVKQSPYTGLVEFRDCTQFQDNVRPELRKLVKRFCELNDNTPIDKIVECLDSLKKSGDTQVGEIITSRLREDDIIYRNRGPREVIRLRGYMLSSLGDVGAPAVAIPYMVAELTYNSHRNPYMVAASARGASGLGAHREILVPYLVNYLNPKEKDDIFDLDHYNSWPPKTPTCIREEVLRTLTKFGSSSAQALPELYEALTYTTRNQKLKGLIQGAIDAINLSPDIAMCETDRSATALTVSFFDSWRRPSQRPDLELTNFEMTDFTGRRADFTQYAGKPTAVTFFYTRCDNYGKCSATISRLSELEMELTERGEKNINLLGITLDPYYDGPGEMLSFAQVRGVDVRRSQIKLLKVNDPKQHDLLMRRLSVPVSYQAINVSIHGIEILLFDKNGRYVRRYSNVHWEESSIVADIEQLLEEG
jgi:protein SCO1